MLDSISPGELAILLAIVLVVMGPEKFPEVAKIILRVFRDLRGYVDGLRKDLADEIRPVQDEIKQMSRFDPMTYVEAIAKSVSQDAGAEVKEVEEAVRDAGNAATDIAAEATSETGAYVESQGSAPEDPEHVPLEAAPSGESAEPSDSQAPNAQAPSEPDPYHGAAESPESLPPSTPPRLDG